MTHFKDRNDMMRGGRFPVSHVSGSGWDPNPLFFFWVLMRFELFLREPMGAGTGSTVRVPNVWPLRE